MFIFDLHCDTAFEIFNQKKSLINNDLNIDLLKGTTFEKWVQVFAFWIDDIYRGEDAYNHFLSQYNYFSSQVENNQDYIKLFNGNVQKGKCNAILAIEGGAAIGGKIERIAKLKQMGISFLTLVWNGENELGTGILGEKGLSLFGKQCVAELEQQNIIVDVSHLTEHGFYDVCEIATKPFVATHSNFQTIHKHKRNLTNEQLKYIIDNKGLCGINFYTQFVNGNDNYKICDLIKHIEHILALGGEDVLALGSDFDGAAMPTELNSVEKLEILYDNMLKYYSELTINKIMYNNAKSFVGTNLTIK